MATAPGLDAALLELGRSMPVASIPEKLRCATCDKLAVNAMRLPCCDNTICIDCKETMTVTECPICTHSPLDASLSVPAKSLQSTIKAFLKTEIKKRGLESAQAVQSLERSAAQTPTTVQEGEITGLATERSLSDVHPEGVQTIEDAAHNDGGFAAEDDGHTPAHEMVDDEAGAESDGDVVITTEQSEDVSHDHNGNDDQDHTRDGFEPHYGQTQQPAMDYQQANDNYSNGNFDNNMAGFNQMMPMQGFGMGMPNMMSMPGMGMDPSMMFNGSYGSGSGNGGMGDVSMMGMGMGNGMGGGMGMGGYNGMAGPGFFPHQGSYMQSNFGNAPRQPYFHDRGGYARPYARHFGRGGRGGMQYGRGRGGSWANQHQHYANPQAPYQSGANTQDLAGNRRGSPRYDAAAGGDGSGNEPAAQDATTNNGDAHELEGDRTDPMAVDNEGGAGNNLSGQSGADPEGKQQFPFCSIDRSSETVDPGELQHGLGEDGNSGEYIGMQGGGYDGVDESMQQQQYGYGGSIRGRGGFRSRGSYGYGGYARAQDSTELTPAPAPPANAPTGPKAMRQGLPNTGWSGLMNSQKPAPAHVDMEASRDYDQAPETYDQDVEHSDRSRSRSRSRVRSPSRSRSRHRSDRRQDRPVDDNYDSDEEYERRKDRERRKRRDRERRYDYSERGNDRDSDDKKHRSRSESRSDDDSRRRRHDRDAEYRSSRSYRDRSRSRHKRRRRSRSPRKETDDLDDGHSRHTNRGHSERDDGYDDGDRNREKQRSRKRSRRDEDYDDHDSDRKDRSHRSSRSHRTSRTDTRERDAERERPRAIIEPPSDELGFKIKGSKSARAAQAGAMGPPASTRDRGDRRSSVQESVSASSDPYAEERARAQQDREAREAQRRQSTQPSSLGKRSSRDDEDPDAPPRGPKNDRNRPQKNRKERRITYRYEDEISDDDREAARWR